MAHIPNVDHVTDETIRLAAEWLASPRERTGRATVPELRDRFGLNPRQAVEAIRLATLIRMGRAI